MPHEPYLVVKMFDALTMTNSPSAAREVLNSQRYRLYLDLSSYTKYRVTMQVNTAGAATGVVKFQGSTDGTNFGDLDASGTTLTLNPVGEKNTGWLTLAEAYRADNVRIRMIESGGDGAADPLIRQVLVLFK